MPDQSVLLECGCLFVATGESGYMNLIAKSYCQEHDPIWQAVKRSELWEEARKRIPIPDAGT